MHPFHRFAQLPNLRRFGHLRLLLFWPLFSLPSMRWSTSARQSIITLCAARWTL